MQKAAFCGWPARGSNRRITKTLLIMKLTTLLLTAAFLNVSAKGVSQTVSFSGKNVPIENVFSAVKKQTGFVFIYEESVLEPVKTISIQAMKMPLTEFLTLLLKDLPIKFTLHRSTILLSRKPRADASPSPPPDHADVVIPLSPVSGHLSDEEGKPVMGVTVTIKRTKQVTVSDAEGNFTINASAGDVLLFTSVEFESREWKLSTHLPGSPVLIHLSKKITALNDVIINKGYYSEKQMENTGNISRVDAKTIEQQPVGNILQALQGRVPGLLVTSNSGVPGADVSIQIRGINSVAAGTALLYIIDGVVIPSTSVSTVSTPNGFVSPLNAINPSDIETVEILKDADATAIYGSRGANGVVLITTKKAVSGKTKLDLDAYTGIGKAANSVDLLNTRQYLQLRRKAFASDGVTPNAGNAPDLLTWDTTAYTNWQKLLIGNTASITNLLATVSGGDARTHFLMGAGYRNEGTIMLGNGSDRRLNTHLNVGHVSVNNRFHMNTNIIYGNDLIHTLANDPFRSILTAPNMPVYDDTGKPYWLDGGITLGNPIAMKYARAKTTTGQFIANTDLSYTLPANLQFRVSVGYTNMQQNQIVTHPTASFSPSVISSAGYTNASEFGESSTNSFILEPQLNYHATIGEGKLEALIGSSLQNNSSATSYFYATNFASDALMESLGAATNTTTRSSTTSQYRYESLLSRINYNWKGKYIVNATARRDGSSRFGPGRQFGNFWSVGAAWLFYKEKNMEGLFPWLSFGKLRSSYGLTGNDQIGDYQYLQSYSTSSLPYLGSAVLYPSRLGNVDYSWESNRKFEAAIELGLLHNRINFSIAWFQNRSGNQLVSYPLASQSGFTSYQANLPALVQNRGWEFQVQSSNISSHAFSWSTSFNLSVARNKLLKYPGLAASSYSDRLEIGQPISLLRLYHFTGIDAQTGVPQVEDVDKDGQIGFGKDRVSAGSRDPKFYGGLGNHFSYKNLSLDIFLQFQKGIGYGYLYTFTQPPGSISNVKKDLAHGAWTGPGDKASHPGLTTTTSDIYFAYNNYYSQSDAVLCDASYIRLKTLSLSYSLPAQLMEKWKIVGLKFFIQGQNLLTFTHYNGIDPETQTATPVLRTLAAGIHVTL
jgi:TonB-linked SusC/RagA family outer membrane protein